MAKYVRSSRARITIGSSVARNAELQAKKILDRRTKGSQKLNLFANEVMIEAERLALAYFGKPNMITRGFTVQHNAKNYPVVTNIAVNPVTGEPIGSFWEVGTGIYGPRRRPIKPQNSKYLIIPLEGERAFEYARIPKRPGGAIRIPEFLFVKEVDGMKGQRFLEKAARNVSRRNRWRYTPKVRITGA